MTGQAPQQPAPDAGRLIALAASAVARIDRQGLRGISRCSVEEIEAMAAVIALTDGIAVLRARLATHADVKETINGA